MAAKDETEDLKAQFETLRNDVSTLVSSLGRTASDSASLTAEELSDRISSLSGDLKARGDRAVSETEAAITKNPIQSMAVALGVGFLIGIFSRR